MGHCFGQLYVSCLDFNSPFENWSESKFILFVELASGTHGYYRQLLLWCNFIKCATWYTVRNLALPSCRQYCSIGAIYSNVKNHTQNSTDSHSSILARHTSPIDVPSHRTSSGKSFPGLSSEAIFQFSVVML